MLYLYFFTDDLTITPTDTRWVGAWWIGFLVCAGVNILTSIPFFFFPKTLPKEGLQDNGDGIENSREEKHGEKVKEENKAITKGKHGNLKLCLVQMGQWAPVTCAKIRLVSNHHYSVVLNVLHSHHLETTNIVGSLTYMTYLRLDAIKIQVSLNTQ